MLRQIMSYLIYLLLPLILFNSAQAAIVVGNPQGKIILTEVFDYQCEHCKRQFPIIEKLIQDNPDIKVRLNPVPLIDDTSLAMAASAMAASQYPNVFAEFTRLIMTSPHLSPQGFSHVLSSLNLNTPDFNKKSHSLMVKDQLQEGLDALIHYKAHGVPLIIISYENQTAKPLVYRGETPLTTLQGALNHVRHSQK